MTLMYSVDVRSVCSLPLVGEGWGGGSPWRDIAPPPPLAPPHKGEGNRPRRAAPLCVTITGIL
jgi:hypothetical protein